MAWVMPTPAASQLAGHGLKSGARRGDDAHATRCRWCVQHLIGKPERDAVDDGRARIGPHDQQPAFPPESLEAHLILNATLSLYRKT
jgi:hypothetical protein